MSSAGDPSDQPAEDWPDGLLLAYYGDDFTGSTDVLEAFTAAGLPSVLFLEPPSPTWLARFPDVRCVGLAGHARGRSPDWMTAELPAAFASLAALGAPILQYKVCSTFDSSPAIGSIGRAIDLGVPLMPGRWSPMIVGAPRLQRYQAFGHLFAGADGVGYRIDRHPTMARHPVTPMAESDLRRHLALQTRRRIELLDFVQARQGRGAAIQQAVAGDDVPVLMIDVLDDETLLAAGQLVWQRRGAGIFCAASSGLQYALAAYWRSQGLLPAQPALPQAGPVPAIAVVSGSCSPVTAAQIGWAVAHGFRAERLDLAALLDRGRADGEIERVVALALAALQEGASPLIHTALGPDDPAVTGFADLGAAGGWPGPAAGRQIGAGLAAVMDRLLARAALPRVVVAGGDSASAVAGALGIAALTVAAGLAPGAPLCRAWCSTGPSGSSRDGLEIVLKGGQMGGVDFFGSVRAGRLL